MKAATKTQPIRIRRPGGSQRNNNRAGAGGSGLLGGSFAAAERGGGGVLSGGANPTAAADGDDEDDSALQRLQEQELMFSQSLGAYPSSGMLPLQRYVLYISTRKQKNTHPPTHPIPILIIPNLTAYFTFAIINLFICCYDCRHFSDVATISYSGYLLKRSNYPDSRTVLAPVPLDGRAAGSVDGHRGHGRGGVDDEHNWRERQQTDDISANLVPKFASMGDSRRQQQLQLQSSTTSPDSVAAASAATAPGELCGVDEGGEEEEEVSPSSFDSAFASTLAFASSFFGVDLRKLNGDKRAPSDEKAEEDGGRKGRIREKEVYDAIRGPPPSTSNADGNPRITPQRKQFERDRDNGSFSQKRRASAPIAVKQNTLVKANSSDVVLVDEKAGGHPPDEVDAEGHTWRAKFCVLEGGNLYFYRYRSDAEAPEAHQERQYHAMHGFDDDSSHGGGTGAMVSSGFPPSITMSPIPKLAYQNMSDGHQHQQQQLHTWEKYVALNAVGAVRSAESEFGPNAFELSAADDMSEKLILRARNQEEMNEWLFQFHRSIASFVLDIMECASSATKAMDIHHPQFAHQPMAPMNYSPDRNNTSIAAFSPRILRGLTPVPLTGGAGTTSATPLLSHGHGRNSLHRRRMELSGALHVQNQHLSRMDSDSLGSSASPVPSFPFMPQPHDSPLTGSYNSNINLRHRVVTPSLPQPPEQIDQHRPASGIDDVPPELSAPQSDYPEMERPPPPPRQKKYVPPHLRNRSGDVSLSASAASSPSVDDARLSTSGNKYDPLLTRNKASPTSKASVPSKRYVPPHLRNRASTSQDNYVPRHAREGTVAPGSYPDDAMAEESAADSIMFFEEHDITNVADIAVRFGGCADPDLVVGSILDEVYIPRKASKLGKTRASQFGCVTFDVSSREDRNRSHQLHWEVGAVSECGVRDSNEDSFLVASDLLAAFGEIELGSSTPTPRSTVWHDAAETHAPSVFAVFDGHCGNHAARFAAETLIRFIHEQSFFGEETEVGAEKHPSLARFQEILRLAISNLDAEFCNLCVDQGRDWESGTTALLAALVNEHLVIANVGDARGIVSRSVQHDADVELLKAAGWNELPSTDISGSRRCVWKQVTDVHSPSRKDERARIEKANGWITMEKEIPVSQIQRLALFDQDVFDILKRCFSGQFEPSSPKAAAPQRIVHISRVCGELAVSRAIGDRDFKAAFNPRRQQEPSSKNSPDQSDSEQYEWDSPLFLPYPDDHSRSFKGDLVSSQPEFESIKVGEPGVYDEFLLLACDGLWDVMDADDAARLTRGMLFEKGWSAKRTASRLAELAIRLGSSDNITVIVVRFCDRDN